MRVDEGIAHLIAVRDLVEPVAPPRELALLYYLLSAAYWLVSKRREELLAAEKAVEYALQADDRLILAKTQVRYGSALVMQGRIADGCATIERYLPEAAQVGDATDLGAALQTLLQGYEAQGDFATAERYVAQTSALAEETAHAHGIAWALYFRGHLALCRGTWDRAQAHFEEAAQRSQAPLIPTYPYCQFYPGHLLYLRGDRERGIAIEERAIKLAEQRSLLWTYWSFQAALAEQELLEDRPEAAARRLENCLDTLGDEARFDALPLLSLLAQAYIDLGWEAEAEASVTRAVEQASAMAYRLVLVDALRVRGLLAIGQGRWQNAEEALEEALSLARVMPYPYAEAKALYVYGKLHVARGESEQAREKYQAALSICERLGEGLYRPHIEHALADLAD